MARDISPNDIPEGWIYGLLDNLAQRCSGHTPSKSFPAYWDGNIKWISLSDSYQMDNGYVFDTEKKISLEGLKNSSAELHPAGTVVLVRDAGIGKSGVMAESMAVSQHFIAWKCDNSKKIVNWYLYNWLQFHKQEFERQAVGSTIKTIGLPFFKKMKIAVPPIEEQRKIAKILQIWDRAIATTEKLIDASKQQKKALMQQLLTGKKRFAGFEGEWEEVKLSSLCDIRRGASPRPISDVKWFSQNGRGWIRIADVTAQKGQHLLTTKQYLSDAGVENSVSVDPGDLIMSICGTIGVPKFLGIKACIHDGFVVFRNISDSLCLEFLYHHLLFIAGRLAADGQPGTQKNLNTGIVGNIRYPAIFIDEQLKIANTLTSSDNQIVLLNKKLARLKMEKKALMQQLLTGKRRVKVDD